MKIRGVRAQGREKEALSRVDGGRCRQAKKLGRTEQAEKEEKKQCAFPPSYFSL